MRVNSNFTYEVVVWVHNMELTLQVRASSTEHATDRVQRALGPTAMILARPKLFRGATSRPFAASEVHAA